MLSSFSLTKPTRAKASQLQSYTNKGNDSKTLTNQRNIFRIQAISKKNTPYLNLADLFNCLKPA